MTLVIAEKMFFFGRLRACGIDHAGVAAAIDAPVRLPKDPLR
jgi:hypothetical protein